MKKSTDILLRIILVVSILGSIFFYYYGKFIASKKVLVKSDVIILPKFPEKQNKQPKKANNLDNKSPKKLKQQITKKVAQRRYTIFINEYPIIQKINNLKDFLVKHNIKYEFFTKQKEAVFKRVFVGPFTNKFRLIKMENRLKKINIETLRIKLKGAYFLHCGSFYYNEKADELKNKLLKSGIKLKDIVIFKFKKVIIK